MESILLIVKSNTKNREAASLSYLPPLGVMSIATVLEMHGYNVEIIDQSIDFVSTEFIVDKINKLKPLYVGVSCYTENINECLNLCKYLKRKTNVKIVIGGPHPTLCAEECIKSRAIDFLVIAEGEASNLEIAEALRTKEKLIHISDIKGILYNDIDRKHIKTEKRDNINNLDLLPIIKRNYIKKAFNTQYMAISSSRGCPGKCIYCAAPKMFGGKYRIREIENVYMETVLMLDLTKYEKEIYYIDDTFTAIIKRVYRYIELIKTYNLKYKWRCESRVDVLSKNIDIVKHMHEAGCQRMQYGIESGNQDVLNKIYKNMDLQKAKELIDYTIKLGINVATSFIFGHYCDNESTMTDTLELMIELHNKYGKRIEIFYSYNTPFPGTYQYDHIDELGMKLTIDSFEDLDMLHPVVETKNFDSATLYNFGRKVINLIYE